MSRIQESLVKILGSSQCSPTALVFARVFSGIVALIYPGVPGKNLTYLLVAG